MKACILALKLLTFSGDDLHQERVDVCEQVIKAAKEQTVPPALALSVAWIESNWTYSTEITKSSTVGPLQIKYKFWCKNDLGIWKASKADGILKNCDTVRRGVFALAWYVDRYSDTQKALNCYSGNCEDNTYSSKVMIKFKLLKRFFK